MRRAAIATLVLAAGAAGAWFIFSGVPEEPAAEPAAGRLLRLVTVDGEPVAGARVRVFLRWPHLLEPEPVGEGITDAAGRVAVPPFPETGAEAVALIEAGGCAAAVSIGNVDEDLVLDRCIPVRGAVMDLAGKPLPGARVTYPDAPPFLIEVRSGPEGRFEIGPVPEDSWIRTEVAGYVPQEESLALYPEGREIAFFLAPEKRVTGRVVDSSGRGVAGAVVELDQEFRTRVAAGPDGSFDLPGVRSDWEVVLTPRASGMVGPASSLLAGQRDVELVLYRPATVSGTVVRGDTEEPVGQFEFEDLETEDLGGGRFRIGGLLPGELQSAVSADGTFTGKLDLDIAEGEHREDITVPVLPRRWGAPDDHGSAHRVTIEVTDSATGEPIAGALLREPAWSHEGRTDANGKAVLRFPDGPVSLVCGGPLEPHDEVEVEFEAPEDETVEVELERNAEVTLRLTGGRAPAGSKLWVRAGPDLREIQFSGREVKLVASRTARLDMWLQARGYEIVNLPSPDITDGGVIEAALVSGPRIRGRCIAPSGHPMAKVVAEVEEAPLEARMETFGDGEFRIGPLMPGDYRVLVYARNVRSRRIDVSLPEEGADIGDIKLLAPADIDVRVVTSAGVPVPAALVETSYLVAAKGLTDGEGRIVLPGTNEEEMLRARAPGFLDAWEELEIPNDRERVSVTLLLLRPARLLVRALDRSGRPVPVIVPRDQDAHRQGPGEFSLENLPPGPLELTVEDRAGRQGRIREVLGEGESRVVTVVLD